jgi:hypothetical protein
MVLVQQLRKKLPQGYVAEPRVHQGSQIEIDVATFEKISPSAPWWTADEGGGGVATEVWAPPIPSLALETAIPDVDEYEVRVYDTKRGRQLVAAIEIVSPANKDRPEHRNIFLAKCAALLQNGIAVSIVDLVTVRQFNLYTELLAFLGLQDPSFGTDPPATYAASCRWVERGQRKLFEAWAHRLVVGQPLPTLPLWLGVDLAVPLDLEQGYEQACHDLWIT